MSERNEKRTMRQTRRETHHEKNDHPVIDAVPAAGPAAHGGCGLFGRHPDGRQRYRDSEKAEQRVVGTAKRLSSRDRAEGRHAFHGPGGGQRRPRRQADAVLLFRRIWYETHHVSGKSTSEKCGIRGQNTKRPGSSRQGGVRLDSRFEEAYCHRNDHGLL